MIKDKKRMRSIKGTFILMAAIVVLLSFCTIMYRSIINTEIEQMHTVQDSLKSEKFDQIYLYMQDLRKSALDNASKISLGIETDMKTNGLDNIKRELDETNQSSELQRIFKENIQGVTLNGIDNSRNGIMVLNKEGFVEDLNYERVGTISRSWDRELANTYNRALLQNAIDKINTHSTEIIAIEYEPSAVKDHIMISELTKDTLEEIYLKEGLEGLRNYQILVPVYITDTGDIFGQDDILAGIAQKNYKFIIVQEFNLYDQLMTNNYDTASEFDDLDVINANYNNIIDRYYILGIFFIVSVIMIILFFLMMYNNFIIGYLNAATDRTMEVGKTPTKEVNKE